MRVVGVMEFGGPEALEVVEVADPTAGPGAVRIRVHAAALQPGQTLAVTGAAGAYGGYLVQLAKVAGLRVVADASPADEALVRALGADVVVARGDDVADRFRTEVPDGVDGLADGALMGAK